ncbi:hypothetical protein OG884_25875 [Streptosporangium sp. NBC_01755]|uniref:hypothetical protein n=1 Tax=unclassified Streptosporangium TaxID=2632669 RepID=UPI002DDB9488|nr:MULTISPECIES: hypothetical protein [unclassified Streptosporangium]WSA23507.1 hypothetical protein OIE13_21355 [Streptosporangium sp. NBC_01810]WSC98284.1 hypothetical protein OG884_25875 [Streptosporangium sp. NBC_01755]
MERNYTLDFVAGDRRDRAILRHMVLSLFVGMLLGGVGALLAYGPDLPYAIYNSCAYILLVVVVGRTAAGFGWAVLSSMLAAFGPLLSVLAATLFEPEDSFTRLGDDVATMNLTLVNLVAIGVFSYLAKRPDRWGGLAAGGAAGLSLFEGIDKMVPGGPEYVPGFWPWGTVVVAALAAGMLIALARRCDRICSTLVALAFGAFHFVFLTGL